MKDFTDWPEAPDMLPAYPRPIKHNIVATLPNGVGGTPIPERHPVEGRIPGNKAIWVGIFSEMTEFAMMFIIYFIAKEGR